MDDKNLFGIETIIDLHNCNAVAISSESKLREYLVKIVQLLEMIPYGEPFVERFGLNAEHTAGYSIVQLIETSSITGHFSESFGSSHINIFSCTSYDAEAAYEFTKEFFGAGSGTRQMVKRYGAAERMPVEV